MIDWRDCIVPIKKAIWVAYQTEWPYLPIAVADSAEELASIIGISPNTIYACWNKYQYRKISSTCYHRIKV